MSKTEKKSPGFDATLDVAAFHAERKAAAAKLDISRLTKGNVWWEHVVIGDAYGLGEGKGRVGRTWFIASPETGGRIAEPDLSNEQREQMWARAEELGIKQLPTTADDSIADYRNQEMDLKITKKLGALSKIAEAGGLSEFERMVFETVRYYSQNEIEEGLDSWLIYTLADAKGLPPADNLGFSEFTLMEVYHAMNTLINLRVDLNHRAAVEAVLNGSQFEGEFVTKNREDIVGSLAVSLEDGVEGGANAAVEVALNGGSRAGVETGFVIAGNPYRMHPVYGPRFIDWCIKAAKANLPGGSLHGRVRTLGEHVPPEFDEVQAV
jgi:hypothetical protein